MDLEQAAMFTAFMSPSLFCCWLDYIGFDACYAGHNYIGTEHILLGLLREGEGVAARVLETLGADPAKIRTQVCRMERAGQTGVFIRSAIA
jgi:hypothetical protein